MTRSENMTPYRIPTFLIALFMLVGLAACDDDPVSSDGVDEVVSQRVTDLPADPFVGFVGGRPVGTGDFTFYSLGENRVVEDSASTEWDVAFRGTTILVNGGASGPGHGAGQIVEGVFSELEEAPASGYETDAEGAPALGTGSGQSWYNYNPQTQIVTPIPGRVIVVMTADGRYAKISMISYYAGAPDPPAAEDDARYLTFDYVLQPDGSRTFE